MAVACIAVLAQHMQHLSIVLISGNYTPIRPLAEEVKKAVCGMAVMAREWEERELAMSVKVSFHAILARQGGFSVQEQNCISGFEKILSASLPGTNN